MAKYKIKWPPNEGRIKAQEQARALRQNNPDKFKDRRLKIKYGITLEEWQSLFDSQGRKCAACGSADPRHKYGWATDHDHVNGKVRGILCFGCNVALGIIKENLNVLIGLARYLKVHKSVRYNAKA